MFQTVLASLLGASIAAHSNRAIPQYVPFELDHGHIFVGAHVNGKGPFRFGFDTGASGIGRIDSSLATLLALPRSGTAASSDGVKTVAVDEVQVDQIRLGPIRKANISVISRDYNKGRKPDQRAIQGIIGRGFFADRLISVDYPSRTITFKMGRLRAGEPGVVAYGEGFAVPVCFASGCYSGKIDTGSSRGIVVPKSLVAKISASEPMLVGQVRRTNGVSSLYEMKLQEDVKIAGTASKPDKILVADPSDDAVNIGSDFLKDYVLTIDQAHGLLAISKPVRR